jgi:hypothetical protein
MKQSLGYGALCAARDPLELFSFVAWQSAMQRKLPSTSDRRLGRGGRTLAAL